MTNFSIEFKDLTDSEFENIADILSLIKEDRSRKLLPKDKVSIHVKSEILRYVNSLIRRLSHEDTDSVMILLMEKKILEEEIFGGDS